MVRPMPDSNLMVKEQNMNMHGERKIIMEHEKLEFVSPSRREEVRRRLTAVRRYLANPCRAEATIAVRELGMSYSNFYILVQAFRQNNDPADIPGATGEKPHRQRIQVNYRRFIDRILTQERDASERQLLQQIAGEAALRGITLPSPPTLQRYIRGQLQRRADERLTLGAEYVLDFFVLRVPVIAKNGQVGRPVAACIIDVVSQRLAGLALSTQPPTIKLISEALMDAASGASSLSGRLALTLSVEKQAEDLIVPVLASAGVDVRTRLVVRDDYGKAAIAELGERVGNIRLERRKIWMPLSSRPIKLAPKEEPMTTEQAQRFIKAREDRSRGLSTLPIAQDLLLPLQTSLTTLIKDH